VRYGTTGPNITSSLIPLMNDLYLDRNSMTICVDMVYPYLLSTTFYGYMKTEIYVFPRGYIQVVNPIGSWFNPNFHHKMIVSTFHVYNSMIKSSTCTKVMYNPIRDFVYDYM
jgi:hypothetical protein